MAEPESKMAGNFKRLDQMLEDMAGDELEDFDEGYSKYRSNIAKQTPDDDFDLGYDSY